MYDIVQELRYALRRLAHSPLFTVIAVATLALAIGANSAVFSVVRGVLLKPLPFEEPERLVGVWHTAPGLGFELVNQSPATYFTYRDEGRYFEDIGMWDETEVTVTGLDRPEQVEALSVTDGTLPLLGVRPVLGRVFSAEDDSPGTAETVMVTHGYWQQRLDGDPQVVGRTLTINGRPMEVIGVLGDEFRFLNSDPQLLLPFQFDRAEVNMGNFSYQSVARLKPGATLEQANADITRMIPMAAEAFPGGITLGMLEEARFGAVVRPFQEDAIGDVSSALWILLGTAGLVLLIACANVANLFLVRAESRQLEMAVRTALGAGRRKLVRAFLSESLLLGALGGAVGLGLAWAGLQLLRATAPAGLPRVEEIAIDPQVLAFTAAIALFAGLLFGIAPGLRGSKGQLAVALKEGGRGGSDGKERHRARNLLVVAQVSMALVLLVGCGLMLRSFDALRNVDPGFDDPEGVFTARVMIPTAEVEDPAQVALAYEEIYRRLEEIPGTESVGLTSSITMDRWDSNDALFVEDFPTPEGQLPPIRRMKWITPGYFQTMGNPLLAGRDLTWNDIHTRARNLVVTENLASAYWDSPAEALGKRVRGGTEGPWWEIIGVVGNVHDDGFAEDAVPVAYWPMVWKDGEEDELQARRWMAIVLRTPRLGTPGLLEEVQEAVWGVNTNLPVANVRTLEEIQSRRLARTAFTMTMLALAAAVALLLGAIGIYGVTSYTVSQRTKELGLRLALGADQGEVRRLVLRQALALAGLGIAVGAGAAFGLARLMQSLLYGVGALDPWTYGSVAAVLLTISLVASYLPARRAARTDPMVALRWD
ncbi:MAG: ABC transporter permease [Acidobacteriota bacterium]|nr:ABC transporter permease [Acidobacteriota bacterium]